MPACVYTEKSIVQHVQSDQYNTFQTVFWAQNLLIVVSPKDASAAFM